MQRPEATTVAILCGGRGTRLQEHTRSIPKPLVEVGERPILWHVIQIYIAQGFRHFVLCIGYKGELIEAFVASEAWPGNVDIECVETGIETPTGGRVHRLRDRVSSTFCVTYADGVADVDLDAVMTLHDDSDALATMTVVRPELPFGVTELDADGRITGFQEKPRSQHWVNGGFFTFDPEVFAYLDETSVLERDPLERLAADGRLCAYRHTGFWECMDTYKDAVQLNDLWANGAPWKLW